MERGPEFASGSRIEAPLSTSAPRHSLMPGSTRWRGAGGEDESTTTHHSTTRPPLVLNNENNPSAPRRYTRRWGRVLPLLRHGRGARVPGPPAYSRGNPLPARLGGPAGA